MIVPQIEAKPTATSEAPSMPEYGLIHVSALALGTFVVGTDAFIVSAFLPSMAKDLTVTPSMAGQSVTVFALAYALSAPVISALTAAIPRRRLLIWALLFLGLANIGSALSPSLSLLILTRIAAAAAAAAYTPTAGAVAAAMVRPEIRARALAVVIGGLTSATALGVPLGHLISEALSWRSALISVGVLSVVAAVGALSIMPNLPGSKRVTLSERLAVLRRREVLVILPLTIIGMAACYVPYTFTVPLLNGLLGASSPISSMLLAYGVGAVMGNYISGWATDRIGPNAVLVGAYVMMVGALGGFCLLITEAYNTESLITVALLMLLWGASSWMQTPAQQHRLISSAPQDANLVVALNSSAIYLGISLGTFVGGCAMNVGMKQNLVLGCTIALISLIYAATTFICAPRLE